jgi:hypothetical protein
MQSGGAPSGQLWLAGTRLEVTIPSASQVGGLQSLKPAGAAQWQVPFWHVSPADRLHGDPLPQRQVFVATSTRFPDAQVRHDLQVLPLTHMKPAPQQSDPQPTSEVPQQAWLDAQYWLLVQQLLPHGVRPAGHESVQWPFTQVEPTGHEIWQSPQCSTSVWVSTHTGKLLDAGRQHDLPGGQHDSAQHE